MDYAFQSTPNCGFFWRRFFMTSRRSGPDWRGEAIFSPSGASGRYCLTAGFDYSGRGYAPLTPLNRKRDQGLHLLLIHGILIRKVPQQKPFFLPELDPESRRHQRQGQPAA